jgi:hypothetical protein
MAKITPEKSAKTRTKYAQSGCCDPERNRNYNFCKNTLETNPVIGYNIKL